jgi:hypothetical protein
MRNNFAATFILLAVGLIFNDVASVHAKPTIQNPYGWKGWQIQQINTEGTNAIFRCYGTFTDYREPQECYKADRIKGFLANGCDARDPIACELASNMIQAEATAVQVEASKGLKSVTGG